jgi:hypothetical protein
LRVAASPSRPPFLSFVPRTMHGCGPGRAQGGRSLPAKGESEATARATRHWQVSSDSLRLVAHPGPRCAGTLGVAMGAGWLQAGPGRPGVYRPAAGLGPKFRGAVRHGACCRAGAPPAKPARRADSWRRHFAAGVGECTRSAAGCNLGALPCKPGPSALLVSRSPGAWVAFDRPGPQTCR